LKHFVAANPFSGMTDLHFLDAAATVQRIDHAQMLMPKEYYMQQLRCGGAGAAEIAAAQHHVSQVLPELHASPRPTNMICIDDPLAQPAEDTPPKPMISFAELAGQSVSLEWKTLVVDEISKWCSAYYDQGQSSWRMPWRHLGLYAAWKAAASLDVNPELLGLKSFRKFVKRLPADPMQVIQMAVLEMDVPQVLVADFLQRQLSSIAGWSGHVQFRVREKEMIGQEDSSLQELLAVRLAYDLALYRQCKSQSSVMSAWAKGLAAAVENRDLLSSELLPRMVAQDALERGYQRHLISKILSRSHQKLDTQKPLALQAVFCIDVRSEILRRALEAQSPEVVTLGFAGFFDMPVHYVRFGQALGSAQCPVLLSPKITVSEGLVESADDRDEAALLARARLTGAAAKAWNSFKTSAISCFSWVEAVGIASGLKILKDSFLMGARERDYAPAARKPLMRPQLSSTACCDGDAGAAAGVSLAQRVEMAAGALRGMSLTRQFARIVLICGHGSSTRNNPYASSLDCGACGGHAGEVNARIACQLLNEPAVREGLRVKGISVPDATIFVPGLHDTTSDEVHLYDLDQIPGERALEVERMQSWLIAASRAAREERAPLLGLDPSSRPGKAADRAVISRSRDWSQVRPEWGLAGNAAFIAAPRTRTKGLNLQGRVFLHEYDHSQDQDHSTLELILCAPMVVANMINLQYFASVVDHNRFGSGNKALHNVVGTIGVWSGNGGDLQTGLPLQSLHDGKQWRHQPLRLSVFIEAPASAIDEVLKKHANVRQLADHEWLHLLAIEEAGQRFLRYLPGGGWATAQTPH
jgi:uncharacterized protein YbcC (UPF0753/DUF2309 family)